VPADKQIGTREKEMAKTLIDQMSSEWEPERYQDEYAAAVMKLVEQKVKAGGKALPEHKRAAPAATNVVDLVQVLQESLKASGKTKPVARATKAKKRAGSHKHAA
jgi:DNA end-binding protein Ku